MERSRVRSWAGYSRAGVVTLSLPPSLYTLDPKGNSTQSRAAARRRAGRLSIHPRFCHGTCLHYIPLPPTCGSSPFGKDLGVGSRWWASFSFCWSRALFPRVSSWHVTRKSISKQAGPPGLTIRPSGAGLPTVPACLAGEVCQAHTMGPHLALGPCPNVFSRLLEYLPALKRAQTSPHGATG